MRKSLQSGKQFFSGKPEVSNRVAVLKCAHLSMILLLSTRSIKGLCKAMKNLVRYSFIYANKGLHCSSQQQLNVFFGPNQCCFPRSDLSGKFFKGCVQRSILFVSTAGAAGTKNKFGQNLFCRIWLTRRQATVLMMSSCSMEILIFRIPRNTMRTLIHHHIVHCTLCTYICNPRE